MGFILNKIKIKNVTNCVFPFLKIDPMITSFPPFGHLYQTALKNEKELPTLDLSGL